MAMRAAGILVAGLLAGCSRAPAGSVSQNSVTLPRPSGGSPDQPPVSAVVPGSAYLGERIRCVDRELVRLGLNAYGDLEGTTYARGSPLSSEVTGTRTNRYDYVMKRRPDIAAKCSRPSTEPAR